MQLKKKDTDKKSSSMSYRTPADMHSDGVYFNEDLLARKKHKELQKKKVNNTK